MGLDGDGERFGGVLRAGDGVGDEVSHDLREYRLSWEKVDGADGCEVQTVSHGLTTGQEMLEETEVYSSPAFFHPAFGRRHFRVRGRMQDHALGVAQAIWAGVIPAGPGNSLPHVPVQRRQRFQPDRAVPGPAQAADAALGLVLPSEPLEIDHQDGDADLVQVPVYEEPGRGRLAVMVGSGFPQWQVQGFGDIVGVHFMAAAAGLEEFPHWHSLIPSPAPGGRWASAGGRRGSSSRRHP